MASGNRIITKEQARHFILAHHGLIAPRRFEGKQGIADFVRKVGCIQFDPLNVVGFNQHLVLQSRIPNFDSAMLDEMLYSDRILVDGWDKNMSIYLSEDWPYFERLREAARDRLRAMPPVQQVASEVLERIRTEGPKSSGDLSYDQIVDWPWAPTRLSRAVLESLYFTGDLVVHHKLRTRKVYDLASSHLPSAYLQAAEPNPTAETYWEWYVLRRIGAIGLLWNKSGDAWLGIAGLKSDIRTNALGRLQAKGQIEAVQVEGLDKYPLYMRTEDVPLLEAIIGGERYPSRAFVLAPLDNMMWDRKLLLELFDFEYRWEVYKPVAERQFGYYVLPVMCGDRFVARFEPSLDKRKKTLVIKNWWWEPGAERSTAVMDAIRECFIDFMRFTGSQTIRLEPPAAAEAPELEGLASLAR
ncbi:protein of unknown function DUF1006 [Paenibacillus curdlanolyticus YK9]|uniref:Winged helix-turn-helix domain-containing protein n=1 Tax=Paenibacillus curdlanolyticus YK9 TaxID=717606 RepID=E0I7G3_9BACL|nr:winged helix DNA-binding domain-containing protein [Paenibacillus curdlanolyticus]EFM11979.1 protein of unknown function DUF1006 [Paenibacillus curdlanolyticus YK9]